MLFLGSGSSDSRLLLGLHSLLITPSWYMGTEWHSFRCHCVTMSLWTDLRHDHRLSERLRFLAAYDTRRPIEFRWSLVTELWEKELHDLEPLFLQPFFLSLRFPADAFLPENTKLCKVAARLSWLHNQHCERLHANNKRNSEHRSGWGYICARATCQLAATSTTEYVQSPPKRSSSANVICTAFGATETRFQICMS
jgi:hypothetical protein